MISNPKHGWCNFDIGSFHGTPSYLTDVPSDLLEAFAKYYKEGSTVCSFDEEGTEFLFVIDSYTCGIFVIAMRTDTQLYDFSRLRAVH